MLETWIKSLFDVPTDILDKKYPQDQIVREELNSLALPQVKGYTVGSSEVSILSLETLHHKIRNCSCENAICDAIIWHLSHPLPVATAHDLIDRGVSIFAMGFTRQVDEVQWRLATITEDALYTLITERFEQPHFSVDQFEKMLLIYTLRYDGVLHMLSFRKPSSPEKKAVFMAAVTREEKQLTEFDKNVT